jgi:hypothetical protein
MALTAGEIALIVIAASQLALLIGVLVGLPRLAALLTTGLRDLRQPVDGAVNELRETAQAARRSLTAVDMLLAEVRTSGVLARASAALDSANAAAGRIDPLAQQMATTLGNARELMDDATQTSQSVRGLAEDLAATNKELAALSGALTDVVSELRDHELAAKLTNVLSDTSVLAADIGVLAENANAFLETGKPLVTGIGRAMGNARARASKLGHSAAALRDGLKSGFGKDEGAK